MEDCEKIVQFMMEKHKRIDILVLAAGISGHSKFRDIQDVQMIKKMMDVNFFGYVNMTKAALPHIRVSKGQFVVVSSISGLVSLPLRAPYCASKFAI